MRKRLVLLAHAALWLSGLGAAANADTPSGTPDGVGAIKGLLPRSRAVLIDPVTAESGRLAIAANQAAAAGRYAEAETDARKALAVWK